MKRFTIITAAALFVATFFTACEKETATKEKEPEIVICFFDRYIPIRVINTQGEDLLDPAKLPGGTVEMKWEIPGTSMPVTKMHPATYSRTGLPDQFFIDAPLTNADKGLSVYFSVKTGDIDTLFIKTAPADTTKPYGIIEASFNGVKVQPKPFFSPREYGIEVVKGSTGY